MRRGVYQSNKENDDIDCLADTIFRHMWDQIEPYIPPDDIQHETAFYSLKGMQCHPADLPILTHGHIRLA
jgi:hypothetical protein